MPAEFLRGYKVEIPAHLGIGAAEIGMLATARAANLPQSAIDAFIAARIAEYPE